MPSAKVRNLRNEEVGDLSLSDAVFGVELNEALIHSAVTNYLANRRQGTSATKTRGDVRGGGKNPGSRKEPVALGLRRFVRLCGVAVVKFTVHNRVIGLIKCRKRCVAEHYARLCRKDCVKEI